MIKIKLATEKPIEDDNYWNYPFNELDYLMKEKENGTVFLLYNGRLYETDEDTEVQKVKEAMHTICKRCHYDGCEWCSVNRVMMDTEYPPEEYESYEETYIRSSTNGDYSPSNPWDAPGMSVSDFIR